ncbi:MAG: M24 family metallopeptidase [Nitrososphaeraceae archaeon]
MTFKPENIFYLTGFWGEGTTIIDDEKTILYVPKLEYPRAEKHSKNCEVIATERGLDMIDSISSELRNKITYVNSNDYSTIIKLVSNLGEKNIIVGEKPFLDTRVIKDHIEIEQISCAAKIVDKLFEICIDEIKQGVTEEYLQSKLIFEGLKMGATIPSYSSTRNPLIIAGGPNGALPHADISKREFVKGDFIVVDITLQYNGYVADATRTFGLGNISNEQKKVYEIVKESQEEGLLGTKNETKTGRVDEICRNKITENGYGENFIHSTGHGIGLEIHEPPWLRSGSEQILYNKMAITIEPGIYLESKFGVRIEDSILIDSQNNNNIFNFNKFDKELITI